MSLTFNLNNKIIPMNPLLVPYYKTAMALHLPTKYLPEIDCMMIELGKKNYMFTLSISPFNNHASIYLAKNKQACQLILKEKGFPVPKSATIEQNEFETNELKNLIKGLKFPLVIKPTHGTYGGEGVQCNIQDIINLEHLLQFNLKRYQSMHVEEFYQGLREYRVLLFKNRILGIVERVPLRVIGDGASTIEQLFTQVNNTRIESLHLDENCLREQGLTLQSTPALNEAIRLVYPVNHAQGGSVHALSKKIPTVNKAYCEKIAKLLDLELVGLDIMCEDINKSFNKTPWLILEANFGPDLNLHESPETGTKTAVSKIILKTLIRRHPFSYIKHRLQNHLATGTVHG